MPNATTLFRQSGRAIRQRKLAASLGAAIVLCFSGSVGAIGVAPAGTDAGQDVPSIQYMDAMAHAGDANTFVPGDAVTVPYTPRVGDPTIIDGGHPVPLPAGSASGVAMAASPNGSVWATGETNPPSGGSNEQAVAGPAIAPLPGSSLRREVYGFLPYWTLGDYINYDVVSTIAYFGIDLNTDGSLDKQQSGSTTTGWAGWTSSTMTTVINAAHAKHVRVVLTVESMAWTGSPGGAAAQTALLSSPTASLNAAQQIAAAVRDRGADGVNLDFEPIASGQSANFVAFVRLLRTQLDAIHAGYELTFCGTITLGNYDAANLLASGAADNVFIMGYDMRDGGSAYAASHNPLTSPRVYDLTDAVHAWETKAPASKILLGLPYYGIAFSTPNTAQYATNISGTTYGDAVWVPYYTAATLAETNLVQYDTIEQSAWVSYYGTYGGAPTWRELYYNDARAMAARYDRINQMGLDGVGIWVLGYDSGFPELNQVLADKFLTDKNPPLAGIVDMPASQTSESFTVSWTGTDDWNGVASYDLQVSTDAGTWTNWLTGTTATSSSFNGSSGHNYAFRVRATDGVGNVGPWDLTTSYTASPTYQTNGFIQVTTANVAERGLPTISSNAIYTVGAGTIFQVIGGPVSADGYTWYQVNGPITELNPVTPTFPGCWIAVGNGTNVFAAPITPPNTTLVSSGIDGLTIGTPGVPPSATGIDAGKTFSPDGDGIKDTIGLAWTNKIAFTDMHIAVYKLDGTAAGSIDLGTLGAGPQTYTWNGTIDGKTVLPDGQYLLQVSGTDGTSTYYAPSQAPFNSSQWSQFGVILDTTPSGTYTPIAPVRILDTRIALGLSGAFTAGASRSFQVTGANKIPAGAMAVTGNLTVTGATSDGYVRLGPSTTGNYSTINFPAGDNRANGVTVSLAPDGSLSAVFMTSLATGSVHLVFDVTGYFARDPGADTFFPITPTRVVDTRSSTGLTTWLTANSVATFKVGGVGAIPANATAIVGNATVTGQEAAGYVTVAPSIGPGIPASSTVNFPVLDNRANNITVQLQNGNLQVEYRSDVGKHTHFVFDVTGYFVQGLSGATYVPLTPGRVVDSRTPLGLPGPVKAYTANTFTVRGKVSVPLSAIAVVGNLTVTAQQQLGWLAITPSSTVTTSTLNFPVGDNRANGFTCSMGPGGTLVVTYGAGSGTATHVVVDVSGYYR